MPSDLTKRAAAMLLDGATLLSEPCPYCSGVRVMKEGHALCTGCGREPEERHISEDAELPKSQLEMTLEKKAESLSKDLEGETDRQKQQEILESINSILDTLKKARNSRQDPIK